MRYRYCGDKEPANYHKLILYVLLYRTLFSSLEDRMLDDCDDRDDI